MFDVFRLRCSISILFASVSKCARKQRYVDVNAPRKNLNDFQWEYCVPFYRVIMVSLWRVEDESELWNSVLDQRTWEVKKNKINEENRCEKIKMSWNFLAPEFSSSWLNVTHAEIINSTNWTIMPKNYTLTFSFFFSKWLWLYLSLVAYKKRSSLLFSRHWHVLTSLQRNLHYGSVPFLYAEFLILFFVKNVVVVVFFTADDLQDTHDRLI